MGKSISDVFSAVPKLVEHVAKNPELVGKTLMYSLPAIAAMELINLDPMGDTIGEYMKNKLVPGLELENTKHQIELDALKEMGSKQIPQLAKGQMEVEENVRQRRNSINDAYGQLDTMVDDMTNDPMIMGTSRDKLKALASDLIKVAPTALSTNPALFKSTMRAAVLSGTDSIDPETALRLGELEKNFSGRG